MNVCGACGSENAPGDAFCGNCGAFLEWVDETETGPADEPSVELAGTAAPPEVAAAPEIEALPPQVAPDVAPAPEIAAASPEVAPAPPPAVAAASPPAGTGPSCPACGRQNDPGRTFCRTCGTRLPTASAPGLASLRSGPVAAVTLPTAARPTPGPVSVTPSPTSAPTVAAGQPETPLRQPQPPAMRVTAPLPAPAVRPGQASPGGLNRTLVAGIAVAVVAVAALGAFTLLGGGSGARSSPAAATSSAEASPLATEESPVGSEEPTAEVTPEASPPPGTEPPTAAPTVPAGPSVGVAVVSSEASSTANSKWKPAKAHDGSPATAWLEGAKDVEGQWIELHVSPTAVTRLSFSAGLQASRAAYDGNPRPHNVTITFDGGEPLPLALTDTFGAQRVDIPPGLGITGAQVIRITIIDTYPAKKTSQAGSPTATTGFSEIRVFGIPVTP